MVGAFGLEGQWLQQLPLRNPVTVAAEIVVQFDPNVLALTVPNCWGIGEVLQ